MHAWKEQSHPKEGYRRAWISAKCAVECPDEAHVELELRLTFRGSKYNASSSIVFKRFHGYYRCCHVVQQMPTSLPSPCERFLYLSLYCLTAFFLAVIVEVASLAYHPTSFIFFIHCHIIIIITISIHPVQMYLSYMYLQVCFHG